MVESGVPPDVFLIQSGHGGTPKPGAAGGGTLLALSMAREWSRARVRVHLISNPADSNLDDHKDVDEMIVLPGISGSSFSDYAKFVLGTSFNFLLQRRALETEILPAVKRAQSAVVVASSLFLSDVLSLIYLTRRARVPGAAYVFHLPPPPWRYPLRRGTPFRTTAAWCAVQLTLSLLKIFRLMPIIMNSRAALSKSAWHFDTTVLELNGFPSEPHHVTEMSEISEGRIIDVGYIGRIAPSKGLKDLIRAFSIARARFPRARLLICGWAPSERYLAKLASYASRMGLDDSVEVAGYVTPQEKARLLSQIKLFVCPSYEEGWSLSVMEAIASGAFPVVYDLPAYSYLGPYTGRVPVGDVDSLGSSICTHLQAWTETLAQVRELQTRIARFTSTSVAMQQLQGLEDFVRDWTSN